MTIDDLKKVVRDTSGFQTLEGYSHFTGAYLAYLEMAGLTRIISPTQKNYFFYQYDSANSNHITRPLNHNLWLKSADFDGAFDRMTRFLVKLRHQEKALMETPEGQEYVAAGELNRVVYTLQQSIGCVGDAFEDANQTRKRIGQLFENLIRLLFREIGLQCESRNLRLPIPNQPGYAMPYELDAVFSRSSTTEDTDVPLRLDEVVGSVKTTSKDRIDKIFLDKFLLSRLLGRDVPVIAIFLHDVQRAQQGGSPFGVASTFKTNHFLGYTVALNRLDGVYYVDPRPDMQSNERLREQIRDLTQLLTQDIWDLSDQGLVYLNRR